MEIELVILEKTDLKRIKDWIDPNVFRIFSHPVDEKQLEKLLPKCDGKIPVELGYKAVDTKENKLIGMVHLTLNHKNNYAHIGQIVVDPDLRGEGIGTEILKQTLDICFGKFGLHRVQLFVDDDNELAFSCYKKVGFKNEGLIRDLIKVGNKYVSMFSMSILEHEWDKQKKGW